MSIVRSPRVWWSAARSWSTAHVVASDAIFALLVGGLAIVGFWSVDPTGSERSPDVWGAALIAGQAGAFVFRRRRPWWSFLGVIVCSIAFWGADYPNDFGVFTVLAVYAATVHGGDDRRIVWRRVGAAVVGLTAFAAIGVIIPDDDIPAIALVGIALIHLTSALIGQAVYDRRRRIAELQLRAERAEAERGMLARHAVLDERSRIARELHDVVAHGMSMIVVQAGAAERALDRDPDASRRALDNIQRVGRQSLTEMRQMLDVLRSEGDTIDLEPQPGIADVARIVEQCRQSGVPTELDVDGAVPTLSAGREITAYRLVQEALTNVVKHAGVGASASVRLASDHGGLRIEVLDNGVGSTATEVARSTGQGIVGMRERVEMYGGRLRAGPRPGGGFRVVATLPADGAAASGEVPS